MRKEKSLHEETEDLARADMEALEEFVLHLRQLAFAVGAAGQSGKEQQANLRRLAPGIIRRVANYLP